jgi:hypothetical protein
LSGSNELSATIVARRVSPKRRSFHDDLMIDRPFHAVRKNYVDGEIVRPSESTLRPVIDIHAAHPAPTAIMKGMVGRKKFDHLAFSARHRAVLRRIRHADVGIAMRGTIGIDRTKPPNSSRPPPTTTRVNVIA